MHKEIYLVDDDELMVQLAKELLEKAGYTVRFSTSSEVAYREIDKKPPDCVILDLIMPDISGLELCKKIRNNEALSEVKIIILTSKRYESDRRMSVKVGADGYLLKPIDPEKFSKQVEDIIADNIECTFWGVHGTVPVPGQDTIRYGGNTSCVSLLFKNHELFVLDAGTGIVPLSNYLMSLHQSYIKGKIFITHPHWDHLNGIPFFAPMYIPGNEFEILGASQGNLTIKELVHAQMDSIYFPITLATLGSGVTFRSISEETFNIGNIKVSTMWLKHPGSCLGIRIEYEGRSLCYLTDNELFSPGDPEYDEFFIKRLSGFVNNTDLLIMDATYNDNDYQAKKGWGHSCASQVVQFSHEAEVKHLCLFHHDPAHTDDVIDKKLEESHNWLEKHNSKTRCTAPAERSSILL